MLMDIHTLFSDEILSILQDFDNNDYDLNDILTAASETYENSPNSVPNQAPVSPSPIHATPSAPICSALPTSASSTLPVLHTPTSTTVNPARFAHPKSDEEVAIAQAAGVPQKTQKDTQYCVNTFKEWRKYRQEQCNSIIPPLQEMTKSQLSHFLTRFILEVRKKNGDVYPPNTLHHIISGFMRQLR